MLYCTYSTYLPTYLPRVGFLGSMPSPGGEMRKSFKAAGQVRAGQGTRKTDRQTDRQTAAAAWEAGAAAACLLLPACLLAAARCDAVAVRLPRSNKVHVCICMYICM